VTPGGDTPVAGRAPSRREQMRISELAEKAGLTAINDYPDREVEGVYISDMVSDIITSAKRNSVLVTLQTHKSLVAAANLVMAAMIVVVKGRRPSDDVVELATRTGIALFVSDLDTWAFARKLTQLGFD
jgi:predicted transcriptional regulator